MAHREPDFLPLFNSHIAVKKLYGLTPVSKLVRSGRNPDIVVQIQIEPESDGVHNTISDGRLLQGYSVCVRLGGWAWEIPKIEFLHVNGLSKQPMRFIF